MSPVGSGSSFRRIEDDRAAIKIWPFSPSFWRWTLLIRPDETNSRMDGDRIVREFDGHVEGCALPRLAHQIDSFRGPLRIAAAGHPGQR